MENLPSLFRHWSEEQNPPIIQLQNRDKIPVAALYLDKLKFENIVICETSKVSEKYYVYLDGIAIFFTYYRKLEKENL